MAKSRRAPVEQAVQIDANEIAEVAQRGPGPIMHVQASVPAVIDAERVLSSITQAAMDPAVDVGKIAQLMELYNTMRAQAARSAFYASVAKFTELKQVIATNRKGLAPGNTPFDYADWPQMEDAIRPWLAACGLAVAHDLGEWTFHEGKPVGVMLYGFLAHKDGHVGDRVPFFCTPNPLVAHKLSPSQAIQQGITYGKRQTAALLLGLSTREDKRDLDAERPIEGSPSELTDEQLSTLLDLHASWEPTDEEQRLFLKWMKVDSIEDVRPSGYDTVVRKLREKISAKNAA